MSDDGSIQGNQVVRSFHDMDAPTTSTGRVYVTADGREWRETLGRTHAVGTNESIGYLVRGKVKGAR